MVREYLLGRANKKVQELKANGKDNAANVAALTCTAVYLKDKVKMLLKIGKDVDSIRVTSC